MGVDQGARKNVNSVRILQDPGHGVSERKEAEELLTVRGSNAIGFDLDVGSAAGD